MLRHRLVLTIVTCLVLAILPVSSTRGAPARGNGQEPAGAASSAPRVVAMGDIHGAYEEFVGLLRVTGLVDDALAWAGGDTILMQTGDFTDRGAGVRPVIALLRRLQREAPQSGGQVLVALGNHEVMNLISEVRDVTPEIMATFGGDDAERIRDEGYREYEKRVLRREDAWAGLSRAQRRQVKDNWISKHPLGYVEYLRELGPDGEIGQWLRQLPFAIVIQDVLFLHAGIAPQLGEWDVETLSARVASEVDAFDRYRARLRSRERITSFADLSEIIRAAARETGGIDWLQERNQPLGNPPSLPADLDAVGDVRERFQSLFRLNEWFLNAPEGPLWFRGYARWDEEQGTTLATELVRRLGVRAIVVGHTPQRNGIRARFGSRVFLIDTGMLASVYGGTPMALEILGDAFTVVRLDGTRTRLPSPPPLPVSPSDPGSAPR